VDTDPPSGALQKDSNQELTLQKSRPAPQHVAGQTLTPVHPRLDQRSRTTAVAGQELNKGESRNSLARAVFIHRLGEIRDRTYENQQHRASGLNFVVTAIILWNTRYLERAVATLRLTEEVPDHLLAHLSPWAGST